MSRAARSGSGVGRGVGVFVLFGRRRMLWPATDEEGGRSLLLMALLGVGRGVSTDSSCAGRWGNWCRTGGVEKRLQACNV